MPRSTAGVAAVVVFSSARRSIMLDDTLSVKLSRSPGSASKRPVSCKFAAPPKLAVGSVR